MDKRDKNIEDFFNSSLEQFSDAPSDRVWAGIAQQLEVDKPPFYKRWMFWANTFMAIAVLFLLSYGYYSTQKAIDLLTIKTNQLEQENQQLKLALTDCSEETHAMISEKEKENLNNNLGVARKDDFVKNTDNQLVKSDKNIKHAFFAPRQSLTFADFSQRKNLFIPNMANLFSGGQTRKGSVLFPYNENYAKANFPRDKKAATDEEVIQSGTKIDESFSEKLIEKTKKSGFHHLAKLGQQRIGARRVRTNFRRSLPSYFIDYVPLNLTQPISRKLDYRIGLSGGWMNTFTDQKDLFGPGYNIGITNELGLFNKVYLTAGLHFNNQNYEVKLNADNQAVLQTYPGIDELTSVVTSINQHAHYIDLPIGLKWYFNENEKGTKFYINPAVAWQFYFPQRFKYEQATNNGIDVNNQKNNQYFGYFGTFQMQLGLEKPLFKKMNFQLGLWAERSFVPLGVENRNIFNTGIRGAIMFN